jgi:hypothetical protein
MKTRLKAAEKFYFGVVTILFLFLVSDAFAQNKKVADFCKDKYALQNLIAGIKSDNEGIRESAIYLAGKYRFIESENALIEQLQVEKVPDNKVLIGLALFRMNSEKGMNKLQALATIDENARVRRMSQAIYNEYMINNYSKTITAQ